MQRYKKNLGKVSLTAEGIWNIKNEYDILSIVYEEFTKQAFVSKKNVPNGIDIHNGEFWMPLNVSGYADNNFIILSEKTDDNNIKSYTLEEAICSISEVGRRPGAIIAFYNENSDRLDIGGRWEIWQFNSINTLDWENISTWQNIYYNYNKFVGWYKSENDLKQYNPFPEIGCYAFVGNELNEANIYICSNKYVWDITLEHPRDYIKIIVDGNVSVGENGNWINNGKDTGIPASIKGENAKTPIFRNNNNIIEITYDNVNWSPISSEIAAWFRWQNIGGQTNSLGKIQISRDNVVWTDLSGEFINNLRINKYIGVNDQLPIEDILEGSIYAKGPYYEEKDTTKENPIYRLWVYAWKDNNLVWIDNGNFQSINAGIVQELGNNENVVMSQKAVTREFDKLTNVNIDIANNLKQGNYILTGRKYDLLSYSETLEGSFKSIKLNVLKNEEYLLTGTGGGRQYIDGGLYTEDITSTAINGTYTYSSTNIGETTVPTHSYNGGWKCIAREVKSGEQYKISGTGGGGARLYCLTNKENVIIAIANSSEVQDGLVLDIQEDGMLYCSFDLHAEYQVTRTYFVETSSNLAGARLYCLTDENGYIIDISDAEESVNNKKIYIQNNGYLYINVLVNYAYSLNKIANRLNNIETKLDYIDNTVSQNTNFIKENKDKINDVETKVESLENILISKTNHSEDITTLVISGYYSYTATTVGEVTVVNSNYDGGWRCIAQIVKPGDKYIITGTGGGGARLYCLVDNNNIIKAIAGSGETQNNFELYIEEAGTLYCSFNNSAVYKIIKEYTETSIVDFGSKAIWKNGSYEFGKTCNLDYTSPNIDRYDLPNAGNIINAIYGWYDELVAKYPNYIIRENCDEVMASIGIIKPAEINDLPMYMYKFIPPKSPNSSSFAAVDSDANRIKAFIITGAHPEYTAVWDCYNAMRLICENWADDKNLEELRWNADIYIIPCYNLYGVNNTTRTNENGVDLNRNAPTKEWAVQGSLGDSTYSGTEAGSEYSTKVLIHYLSVIKPQIFIDHHNTNVGSGTNEGDGKNMIYTHCVHQIGIDLSAVLISQMTRKWKMRYTDTFPSVETDNILFGYTLYDHIKGSIGRYAAEQGCLGSTYESNFGILYKNGIYSTDNRQTNNIIVNTCATEGFINYLLRSLTMYSQYVGVNNLE